MSFTNADIRKIAAQQLDLAEFLESSFGSRLPEVVQLSWQLRKSSVMLFAMFKDVAVEEAMVLSTRATVADIGSLLPPLHDPPGTHSATGC